MLIIEVHRCNLKHREIIVRIKTKLRHRLSLPITPSLSVSEGSKEGKGGGGKGARERKHDYFFQSSLGTETKKRRGRGLAVGRFRLVFVPSWSKQKKASNRPFTKRTLFTKITHFDSYLDKPLAVIVL